MTTFTFPLQRVFDWRRTQLQLAEARVEQQLAALAEIDRERAGLDATRHRTEAEVRHFTGLDGGDLSALGSFRQALKGRDRALSAKRVECQKELAVRQAAMLEARRRCRLLEHLKEKRLTEWQSAADRELDEVAADSYLAQWARALSIQSDIVHIIESNDS
jgi:flagellar export protein FliJ